MSPPSNVGQHSTPNYDTLMMAGVHTLSDGSTVFVGQSDDPFWVDVGAILDLLSIRKLPGNMGGGIDVLYKQNAHAIALQVPISMLTSDGSTPTDAKAASAVIGTWTTASRMQTTVLQGGGKAPTGSGEWVQVSRLGAPLVNEVVVPLGAKDLWNNSKPKDDAQFLGGVTDPELAKLFKLLFNIDSPPAPAQRPGGRVPDRRAWADRTARRGPVGGTAPERGGEAHGAGGQGQHLRRGRRRPGGLPQRAPPGR